MRERSPAAQLAAVRLPPDMAQRERNDAFSLWLLVCDTTDPVM